MIDHYIVTLIGTPVPGSTGTEGVSPPWDPWRPRYPNGDTGIPWWGVLLIIIVIAVCACYGCTKAMVNKCKSIRNTIPPRPAPARRQRQQRAFVVAYYVEYITARSNRGFSSENNN